MKMNTNLHWESPPYPMGSSFLCPHYPNCKTHIMSLTVNVNTSHTFTLSSLFKHFKVNRQRGSEVTQPLQP